MYRKYTQEETKLEASYRAKRQKAIHDLKNTARTQTKAKNQANSP